MKIVLQNYINGKEVAPVAGKYFDETEPSTSESYVSVPASDAADLQHAIAAAENAFEDWSNRSAENRAEILERIAQELESNLDSFAIAESKDTGKPLKVALSVDIPRSVANLRFFARAITQFSSESHYMPQTGINYTLRKPIGIVGCISPWNLPLYLFTWKIAPALAAGNCVIAKPSEVTPVTAWMFSQICIKAGLPPGVLNILHGKGTEIGQLIVEHSKIKAISFTGGTTTGKNIAATAAPMFKKLSLELGGKNPTLVFADSDLEQAVSESVRASFSNQGQICLCGSRIFIEKSVYELFRNAFVEKVKKLVVGDPNDERTIIGSLVSEQHLQKVLSYIQLAKEEDGTILTGGERFIPEGRCKNGAFLLPTVIEGLSYNCRVQQEEIFGPVVTLTPFENENEAISMANFSPYGLAASLWTNNVKRAHRIAEKLESGIVWVNSWMVRDLRTPFGGMKNSGVGREGGWEALRFFTEPKNIFIKY